MEVGRRRPVQAAVLALLLLACGSAQPASADGGGAPVARYYAATAEEAAHVVPGFGAVAHAVDDEGTLWLAVSLRGAAPLTVHEVFLVCGPTVEESCGYAAVGSVTTDERGDADSGEVALAPGALEAGPFGASARRDHLTIVDWAANTSYVGAALAYALP
jgi:hypothetical protein